MYEFYAAEVKEVIGLTKAVRPSDRSIRQHTSAYVIIRQHTSAYVSIRQHTSAYVIGLSEAVRAGDSVFFARYRRDKSLLHWLAHGTWNSDPYGVHKEEEIFSIDIAHLHSS